MADNEKTLIASSEFDPAQFVKGIDLMAAALDKLSQQEGAIQTELKNIDNALKTNRAEYRNTETQIKTLDKSSTTYKADLAALTQQKKVLTEQSKTLKQSLAENKVALDTVNKSADSYKTSLVGISTTTKQVADENKGRQLFDVTSLGVQVEEIAQAGAKIRNVFKGKISTAELDKFEDSLSQTNDEFVKLGQIVDFVRKKMELLDPNSEEFADLNKVVEAGTQVLEEYGNIAEKTSKQTGSLKSQLTAMKNELSLLEEAGKDNTQEFQDLAVEAGKLEDQLGDTRERIRILASDTKNLDFGIGAIRGVTAAFGVAEGAAAVFGLREEELQKSLQRLNAIMLILNGLQELQTLLQKESVVAVVGQQIATNAAAAAQRIYAVVIGTSTGALKAFKLALLATGIGAFIILLGVLTNGFGLFNDETTTATESTDSLTEAIRRQDKALTDLNDTLDFNSKLRIESLKQTGATDEQIFQEELKARKAQLKNLQDAEEFAARRLSTFKQQQTFRAAETQGNISQKEREASNASLKLLEDDDNKKLDEIKNQEREIELFEAQGVTKRVTTFKATFDKQAALFQQYLDRLTALQRQLRDKQLGEEIQDEATIRKDFANHLNDALADIDKDVKTEKLTATQAAKLKEVVRDIAKIDVEAAAKTFKDKQKEVEEELSKELFDLRVKNGQQRAELIRDQFQREAAIVEQEAQQQIEGLQRERLALIANINKTRDLGLISPQTAEQNVAKVSSIYQSLFDNIAEQTARKREEITNKIFDALQEETKRTFDSVQLVISQTATDEIATATELLRTGAINYEEYQKRLTDIALRESKRRIDIAIQEQQALLHETKIEIAKIETKPESDQDKGRLKELQDKERDLRKQIDALERERDVKEGEAISKDDQKFAQKIARVAEYAQAINSVAQQVIAFWQSANEAEQKSLEKSIALQQTRVEAATRLAERGNSEFLRLEEDRLQELQVKQENAARRQIAVNAVLQGSQAITAFISALAQGAATGGALGAIAASAALIALIGAGYAIVQSLQPATPSFFVGTKDVQRGGHPVGRDTIPAMLHEGEAVIPTSINKEYKPTVAAIFDKKIPAEVINNFVNNYKTVNNGNKSEKLVQERSKSSEREINRETKSDSKSYEKDRQVEKHLIERETIDFKALQTIPPDVINNFVNHYKSDKDFRRFYETDTKVTNLTKANESVSSLINNYQVNNRVFPRIDGEKMGAAAEVHIQADGRLLQATREQTKKIEENTEVLHRVEYRLKTMGVEVNLDKNGLAVSLMKAVNQFKIDKKV